MCKEEEEMVNHILLYCLKADYLWQLIYALFGVQWVMHSSVRGALLSWHRSFVGQKRKKGLEDCSIVFVLNNLMGEEQECF